MQKMSVQSIVWNVRFDHEVLKNVLADVGFECTDVGTQAIQIGSRTYEDVFASYNATTRRKVRNAQRRGVRLRRSTSLADLDRYYDLYQQMVRSRPSWNLVYPKELWRELLRLEDAVTFVVAEIDDRMVGGAYFVEDDSIQYYWHGAVDYAASDVFPYNAVLDHGIRLACDSGMNAFNFGGSIGIDSLEQFKGFWGSEKLPHWRCHWRNPLWRRIGRLKQSLLGWK